MFLRGSSYCIDVFRPCGFTTCGPFGPILTLSELSRYVETEEVDHP